MLRRIYLGKLEFIEIAGDIEKGVNIHSGFDDSADYSASRDGQMLEVLSKKTKTSSKSQHSAGVYWNLAMRPGWQKWRPNYRYGTITSIDTANDKCNVTLDACLATDTPDGRQMDVNQTATLSDVPIEYMNCDSLAFEVNDEVVVKFENHDWDDPKVIGFKKEPKRCGQWIVVKINKGYCTVLDLETGEVATKNPNELRIFCSVPL